MAEEDRLFSWLGRALPHERREGELAYDRYRSVMVDFAEHYGHGVWETCEAFCALSPNNDYKGNLRSLASVLQHCNDGLPYTVSTYRACAERAISYLKGEASFDATVGGPKIRAFKDNIMRGRQSNCVTIDGHMIAVLWGDNTTTMKDAAALLKGPRNYDRAETIFKRAAYQVNMIPCHLQATVWLTRKRVLGVKMTTQTDAFGDPDDATQTLLTVDQCPPYKTLDRQVPDRVPTTHDPRQPTLKGLEHG